MIRITFPWHQLLNGCRFFAVLFLAMTPCLSKGQGSADQFWQEIQAMEQGPEKQPKTRTEAIRFSLEHASAQQAKLQAFLEQFPNDPRAFDARIRFLQILASAAALKGDRASLEQAYRQLEALEKSSSLSSQQAADASFARVSLLFFNARGREDQMRDSVVAAASNFYSRFPEDPRAPRLLVEAATACDAVPNTKKRLLETALLATREDSLKQRINDDLSRIDRLGRVLDLSFKTLNGDIFQTSDHRGKIVVLIFWSADSPHSILWMQNFLETLPSLPNNDLVIATVSLDEDKNLLEELMREMNIKFPTGFDGQGWQNATARSCGINALPTVWIFDREGKLRTLNAASDYAPFIRQLTGPTRRR